MVKKRRIPPEEVILDPRPLGGLLAKVISDPGQSVTADGVRAATYHLLPQYGFGRVHHFAMDDMELTISKFQPCRELKYVLEISGDYIQISFLIEGEKIISLEGRDDLCFESGESYLAGIHSLSGYGRIAGSCPFKEIKIRLPASFLINHGFFDRPALKELTDDNLILPITGELLDILADIEENHLQGLAKRIYLKAKVLELLALQLSSYKKQKNHLHSVPRQRHLKALYRARKRIKDQLNKNFSLSELALESGMDQKIFHKEFIRVFGQSAFEFSTAEKLGKAKSLLRNSQMQVYEIAEAVGYKNATHFSAAFKRNLGMTPLQFRKKK